MSIESEATMDDTSRVGTLVSALRGRGPTGPREAREALVKIGNDAVPALIDALRDHDSQVRWEAAKALQEIRSASAAPALVAALQDENGDVRWLAAEALIGLGRDALLPLLHALIAHSESVVMREGAHHVLSEVARDKKLTALVTPVVHGLEGPAPQISCLAPAEDARKQLEVGNR